MNLIQNPEIGLQTPDGQPLALKLAEYIYSLAKDPTEPVMYWWQPTIPA